MFDLGKNIRNLRKDSHLTQEELGKKVGLSKQVISNIERGYTTSIDPQTMKMIADVFQVPIEAVIGEGKVNTTDKDLATFVYENAFPEKLKDMMASKLIDSEMLSDKTGISEERIDAYLYSRKQPFAEDLIKLSEFFEVSIDYLLDVSRRKSISADEENLLHYYNMMNDECKKLLSSEAYLLYVKGISGVAAPEYGKYLDEEKKLYPSSGTGGIKGA